ncbi:MAG: amino acid permease [Bacteroidota bacterium]
MNKLQQKISLYGLTMIVAGSCIGSGIFRSPSETAAYLPYNGWMLLAWIVGGLITLTGALSIAELGGMYPHAGGVYVYLRKVYGDAAAFLYGWISLTVIVSGALAAIALVFAGYVSSIFHLNENEKIILSIITLILLSAINILGVKIGNLFASVITTTKLLGIFAVIIIGIAFGSQPLNFHFNFSEFHNSLHPDLGFFSAFGLASIGVFFSYGGFHHASYLAGEVKNPQKTLPTAMILGTLIVMLVYVMSNVSYLKLLPIETIAGSDKVASTAVSQVFSFGSNFIAMLIIVSTFGTISIYSMTAPRIYFALANDGLFFKRIATIHPRFHTPANAIMVQCAIACIILVFWKTFEEVINYIVFVDYLFMAMAVFGVLILRKRLPNQSRPYRTLGYPIVPLIFVGFTIFMLGVNVVQKPEIAISIFVCLLIGYLLYKAFGFKGIKNKNPEELDKL